MTKDVATGEKGNPVVGRAELRPTTDNHDGVDGLEDLIIHTEIPEMMQEPNKTDVQQASSGLTEPNNVEEVDVAIPFGNVLASDSFTFMQNSLLESNTARGVVDTLPEVDGESLQPVDEPILEVSLSGDGLEHETDFKICTGSENDLNDKLEHIGKEENNAYDTKKRPKGGKVTRLRSSTRS